MYNSYDANHLQMMLMCGCFISVSDFFCHNDLQRREEAKYSGLNYSPQIIQNIQFVGFMRRHWST